MLGQLRRDKSAGLGDFGQLGIEQFVHQHRCNKICRALRLCPLVMPSKLLIDDGSCITEDDDGRITVTCKKQMSFLAVLLSILRSVLQATSHISNATVLPTFIAASEVLPHKSEALEIDARQFTLFRVKKSSMGYRYCTETDERQNTIFSERESSEMKFFTGRESLEPCGPFTMHEASRLVLAY